MRCRLIRFNSPWHPLPTTHVDDRVSLIYKERAVQVPSDPDQGDQSSTKIELAREETNGSSLIATCRPESESWPAYTAPKLPWPNFLHHIKLIRGEWVTPTRGSDHSRVGPKLESPDPNCQNGRRDRSTSWRPQRRHPDGRRGLASPRC